MSTLLLFAILLAAAATVLLVRSLTLNHIRSARTVARISDYGFGAASATATAETGKSKPALPELAARLGRSLPASLRGDEDAVRATLVAAGLYRTTPAQYFGARIAVVLVAVGVWLWAWAAIGLSTLPGAGLGVLLVGAGWILPATELKRRRAERLRRIDRALPDLVDFLVVTVEAGIGFPAALQAAASRFPAPLGEELRLAVQGQRMGLSVEESLRDMMRRVETPSTVSFVRSLVQGETLGVSIGQILRSLATEMRARRRQQAEEQAQKAPIKMLFPLATLIFPAIFIVVLGPAVYDLLSTLGGH